MIESKSEVRFYYNDRQVDASKRVSVDVKNEEVGDILAYILPECRFEPTEAGIAVLPRPMGADSGAPQATQKKKRIRGTLLDAKGEPIIGANVLEKGTNNGTITDADGRFSLSVSDGATINVSYIGYVPQSVKIGKKTDLRLVMNEDSQSLDEVVVVGYGSQKKVSVTGAISDVRTKDLKQSAAANFSNALSGRMAGLTTMQTSGMPGADDVSIYIRGASTTNGADPLILVDGVPRDNISILDPNEIASVSILKDASATAVFGVRGANGVILITTRRGETGKSELSVSAEYSMQQFATKPDRIHSWEFAELRNQAFRNDGYSEDALPYSQWMIDRYKSGEDPIYYPDRDVWGEFFKKWSPQTRVNVNMNGGTDKLHYFMNAAYLGQGGQFKTEDKKTLGYDPSYKMNRYNFRSNLDYQAAKNFKLSLNLATYLERMNTPNDVLYGGSLYNMIYSMVQDIWNTPPTDPGPLTQPGQIMSDGREAPVGQVINQSGQDRNTWGDINRRGYRSATYVNLQSSLALDWGLDFITKGLSTRVMIAFDTKANNSIQGSRTYDSYGVSVAKSPDEKSYYTEIRANQNDAISLARAMSSNYYLNLQWALNYNRRFGLHDVGGMILAQRDNWQTYAADLPYNVLGLSGRATYAYDSRYLAEVNIGYNGSEQFAKGHRFGLFPAFSAGWIVSNESFLKHNPVITNLKLRASYGKVGNDKLGGARFLYLSNISMGSGPIPSLGRGKGVNQGRLGNPNLSWEIAYKQNYGVDVQLWKELSLSFNYFKEKRENVLISRGTVPELQGVALGNLPKVNMGIIDNHGYEVELAYNKQINKDFFVGFNGNIGFNKNTQRFMDEPQLSDTYAYRYRSTGYSIGQTFGYKINYDNGNGYINTPEELEWAKKTYQIGGTPRMGDFLYRDITNDGIVNERDIAPIKYGSIPRIAYGFSGNLKYKNVDLSFLFSGIAKASRYYDGHCVSEFGLVGFFSGFHLQAWTPERYAEGADIKYPALGSVAGTSHNANDFFIMDRSFLRLKNLEVGYTFPTSWFSNVGINSIRLYVNGNNLLTFSKFPLDWVDPEQSTQKAYPLTRMINFGANVIF